MVSLACQALADLLHLGRADLGDFEEPGRLGGKHFERIFAESAHDGLGEPGAHAFDEARAQVALDAFKRLGRHADDLLRLELPPVHLVRSPLALGLDGFALPHRRSPAHYSVAVFEA